MIGRTSRKIAFRIERSKRNQRGRRNDFQLAFAFLHTVVAPAIANCILPTILHTLDGTLSQVTRFLLADRVISQRWQADCKQAHLIVNPGQCSSYGPLQRGKDRVFMYTNMLITFAILIKLTRNFVKKSQMTSNVPAKYERFPLQTEPVIGKNGIF